MAQWLICPFWISEHREREGLGMRDDQLTELHITNPSDHEGRVELLFYEARGDGRFYPADWASGTWSAPAKWQRALRLDPSLVYGSSFFVYGWFEAWTDIDELIFDVKVHAITRSTVSPGADSISQRTVPLLPRAISLIDRITNRFLRPAGQPVLNLPVNSRILRT